MVAIAEAFALLLAGSLVGVLTALVDIMAFGAGLFVAHFSLWVLFNALVAIHVDSRARAIWWAIPFNLGYMEFYYICTAASFEGYAKSLVVPLVAMAFISPMLSYALWTAKRDRGPYGKILSLLIAAGVVGAGYLIFGDIDVYTSVVAAILLLVLWFWPARRLKFTPAAHPSVPLEDDMGGRSATRQRSQPRGSSARRRVQEPDVEDEVMLEPEPQRPTRRSRRTSDDVITRGRGSQRSTRGQEKRSRDAQRRAAAQRRARRERANNDEYYSSTTSSRGSRGRY